MSIERSIDKNVRYTHIHTHTHTHKMEYYSAIKKEWNNAIFRYMDGPRDYHTKWSKSDKTNIIQYHLYVESEKLMQMNLFTN